jgi:hypothetical protein
MFGYQQEDLLAAKHLVHLAKKLGFDFLCHRPLSVAIPRPTILFVEDYQVYALIYIDAARVPPITGSDRRCDCFLKYFLFKNVLK